MGTKMQVRITLGKSNTESINAIVLSVYKPVFTTGGCRDVRVAPQVQVQCKQYTTPPPYCHGHHVPNKL